MYVGLVFAVACYPDVVVALEVGCGREVTVDECLRDVKHGAGAGVLTYDAQPCAHGTEQGFGSAHLLDHSVGWLNVENRGQVALREF